MGWARTSGALVGRPPPSAAGCVLVLLLPHLLGGGGGGSCNHGPYHRRRTGACVRVCVRARACNYDQCVHHRNWLRHVCVRVGVSVGKMRSCLASFYTR